MAEGLQGPTYRKPWNRRASERKQLSPVKVKLRVGYLTLSYFVSILPSCGLQLVIQFLFYGAVLISGCLVLHGLPVCRPLHEGH